MARNELRSLNNSPENDFSLPAGIVTFTNKAGEQQGFVVELVRSTQRASFTGIDAFPDTAGETLLPYLIDRHAQLLVEGLSLEMPKIHQSSHPENICVWAAGQTRYGDHTDYRYFYDSSLPRYQQQFMGIKFITIQDELLSSLETVTELNGYRAEQHQEQYIRALENAFQERGVPISLPHRASLNEISAALWNGTVAYRVFTERVKRSYQPDAFILDLLALIKKESLAHGEGNTTRTQLNNEISTLIESLNLMLAESRNPGNKELLSRVLAAVQHGRLTDALLQGFRYQREHETCALWTILWEELKTDRIPAHVFADMERGAHGFFYHLEGSFFSRIRNYFDAEIGLLQAAQQSAPETEKTAIARALKELGAKQKILYSMMNGGEEQLLRLLRNEDNVLYELLTLSNYRGIPGALPLPVGASPSPVENLSPPTVAPNRFLLESI